MPNKTPRKRSIKNDLPKDGLTIRQRRALVKYINQIAYAIYMWSGTNWYRNSSIYFNQTDAALMLEKLKAVYHKETFIILSHKLSKV